jgi:uncharacterized protein YdeI (BOF family)
MRKLPSVLAIAAIFIIGTGSLTYGADPLSEKGSMRSGTMAHTVTGVVLKIDGDVYVVKQETGKEVRVQVDKRTTMIGNIRPGDSIEAQVLESGRAISIKQLRV